MAPRTGPLGGCLEEVDENGVVSAPVFTKDFRKACSIRVDNRKSKQICQLVLTEDVLKPSA